MKSTLLLKLNLFTPPFFFLPDSVRSDKSLLPLMLEFIPLFGGDVKFHLYQGLAVKDPPLKLHS